MRRRLVFFGWVFTVAALGGCATHGDSVLQSTDPNLIFVGDSAPAGYPKSYTEQNGPSCESVTESWIKDQEYQTGKVIWRKVVARRTVTCG